MRTIWWNAWNGGGQYCSSVWSEQGQGQSSRVAGQRKFQGNFEYFEDFGNFEISRWLNIRSNFDLTKIYQFNKVKIKITKCFFVLFMLKNIFTIPQKNLYSLPDTKKQLTWSLNKIFGPTDGTDGRDQSRT